MGNPKSGSGRLREPFITKFKSQFKWGFAKVVVTGTGRLLTRVVARRASTVLKFSPNVLKHFIGWIWFTFSL